MPKVELDLTMREVEILGEAIKESECSLLQAKLKALTKKEQYPGQRENEINYLDHWLKEYETLLKKVSDWYDNWYANATEEELDKAGLG